MNDLKDILSFQFSRKITSLAKLALEFLEENREERLKLQALLKNAGFEDNELFRADDDFKIFRKKILDFKNESERELLEQIKMFDINLKK